MRSPVRCPDRNPTPAVLAYGRAGRLSMPFLPTLATVIVLAAASVYCPGPRPAAPGPEAALPAAPALAAVDVAVNDRAATDGAVVPAPPPLAPMSFAALYPVTALALPQETGGLTPHAAPRAAPRLASAVRRPCPGRRCPESPIPRGSEALPLRTEAAERESPLPPGALPFADALARTLAPALRAAGATAGQMADRVADRVAVDVARDVAGELAGRAAGGAAEIVRGAAAVRGSVALLAECLP